MKYIKLLKQVNLGHYLNETVNDTSDKERKMKFLFKKSNNLLIMLYYNIM